ncbi:MAG: gliding motility-associated C-terminal domain-containing protein [Bacteroidia bacterium]|nr:gliding motility-associated C-terminal domain-containing protein [Bacteroidia bacterium]
MNPRLLIWILLFGSFSLQAQQRLYFTPNEGQWKDHFVARSLFQGGAFFLKENGFRVKLYHKSDLPNIHKAFHFRGTDSIFNIRGHVLDFEFIQASKPSSIVAEDEAPWYENYFLNDDPKNWKTGIYPVGKMKLSNVYPGIDLVVYTKGEQIEYDWVVSANANPENIQIAITGEDSVTLKEGVCIVHTSVGDFIFNAPKSFQQGENAVESAYQYADGVLKVKLGNYNRAKPLIIDPVLVFSTYSGSRGDNFGYTATYDTGGHLYAGGIVDSDQGTYPVTTGAFQLVYGGRGPAQAPVWLPCDASISKYKPNGSSLVWASYLGGSSNEYPHSLGIDEKNNLLVLGTTTSSNFPITKLTAVDSTFNGKHDIYVVKISADGKKLMAGTYLGGPQDDGINNGTLHYNYADDFRGDIICDATGSIYFSTCTRSPAFPTTLKSAQPLYNAGLESIVVSLNSNLSKLRWSTFVGGSKDDAAYSIKMDDSANIIVGGGTSSVDFPIGANPLNGSYLGGLADGYVLKLTSDTGKFITSTYWGTESYDQIYFVDYDNKNKIYITGQTDGTINRTSGTYGQDNTTQFIARLENNLDVEEFVTTFGNRNNQPELSPCAFLVDKCYNIYFSGWGSSVGAGNAGTSAGLEVTPNAYQKTTDNNDFYLIVLGKDAKSLIYATYFGGDSSEDHVDGGTSRFDKRGVIYQSVCSSCPNNPPGLNDFPTTPGAAFPINVSYRCSNASFKFDFNITYAVEADFTAVPRKICSPDTVYFYQSSAYGRKFIWTFGDGGSSNATNPVHVYTVPGKYTVKLVVIDSGSCNVTDSHLLDIDVLEGPVAKLETITDPCASEVQFKITGENFGEPQWDLGDGTKASGEKIKHNYIPGTYKVKVNVVNPLTGCKDSIIKAININKDSLQDVFLANVFTPNGDTKNECFRVFGLSKYCDDAELKIFNRWGERVFFTDDLSECWNGTVNNLGVELPEGTYFYQVFLFKKGIKKVDKIVSGSITLIR